MPKPKVFASTQVTYSHPRDSTGLPGLSWGFLSHAEQERLQLQQEHWGPGHKVLVTDLPIPWLGGAVLREHRGRLVLAEVHIFVDEKSLPEGGLTGDALRKVSTSRTIERFGEQARVMRRSPFSPGEQRRLRTKRQQGRGRPAEFYATISKNFLDAIQESPTRPHVVLARVMGVTTEDTHGWVKAAREKGWLTKSGVRGKASATATPKLQRWMKKQDEMAPKGGKGQQ